MVSVAKLTFTRDTNSSLAILEHGIRAIAGVVNRGRHVGELDVKLSDNLIRSKNYLYKCKSKQKIGHGHLWNSA